MVEATNTRNDTIAGLAALILAEACIYGPDQGAMARWASGSLRR